MTSQKSAARPHASNQAKKSLKPLARNSYGPHPLRTAFAVVTGSMVALSGVFLLQSTVVAQVAPATVRTTTSTSKDAKQIVRVEAGRSIVQVPASPKSVLAGVDTIPLGAVGSNASSVGTSNSSLFALGATVLGPNDLGANGAGPNGSSSNGASSNGASSNGASSNGASSNGSSSIKVGAATSSEQGAKASAAVLATGAGPINEGPGVVAVQLASLIQEMPAGDLGPLVVASGAITLNQQGREDIALGRVDQRVLAMLLAVSFQHQIEVTVLRSGHSKFVKGTNRLSNHVSGRAADIGVVDGRLVRQTNKAARSIVDQLLGLPATIRPTEIGSPWDTDDPETFTNSGHDDHLHIGFDN